MEEAAANADTAASSTSTESAKGGADPAPIPYPVFKQVNDELKALKAEVTTYGKSRVEAMQAEWSAKEASFNTKLELARHGVQSPHALDYLTDRYGKLPTEGRPPVMDWVAKLRSEEPAFFGGGSASATGASSTNPNTSTNPPPKTSPDANATTPGAAKTDQPLTGATIAAMEMDEYMRRRPEILAFMAQRGRR
jgi:hypothetical protein